MVVNKRRKVVKYRGHTTHGCGSGKKRRGAGSKGGRGRAGTGKRAGQKKAGLKNFKLGRKKGFVRIRGLTSKKSINLGELTLSKVNHLLAEKKAVKESETYVIDLSALGYDKLLGGGENKLKLKLIIEKASASAAEKVKAAGGQVVSSSGSESEKTTEE